jgi:CRISPR-associated protein Csm4
MKIFKFTLRPLTPFGTPLAGDTMFGHLCWAVRERNGERGLAELLEGYATGHPFLVVSDALPRGFLPRPTAPDFVLGLQAVDPSERKRARTHRWLPVARAAEPVSGWMAELTASETAKPLMLTQNSINRYTGTTGIDQFAPRQVERSFFAKSARLDIYAVFDDARVSAQELLGLFEDIGTHGYGRDATTGLGKFEIESMKEHVWPDRDQPHRHWLTLAPCVPDAKVLMADDCYYLPLTRFGRHGNLAAVLDAPFKRPILMIGTGAVLKAREPAHWLFHGRGLGGREAPLSKTIPETVHQGYAPVVPLCIEDSP